MAPILIVAVRRKVVEDRDRPEDFPPDDFDIESETDAADEHDQTA